MILLAEFWENPAVVGLILAIPATILGYLGYRRSLKVDEATKEAGQASGNVAQIAQVVDGLNKVIANLQEDNKVLRVELGEVRGKIEVCLTRIGGLEVGSSDLQSKNRELEREIAVLHFENDALKVENEKLIEKNALLETKNALLEERVSELEKNST